MTLAKLQFGKPFSRTERVILSTTALLALIGIAAFASSFLSRTGGNELSDPGRIISLVPKTFPGNNVIHLGIMLPGESKTVRFTLRNDHQVPIRLTRLEPSCGCTHVTLDKRFLEPGAETHIDATVTAPDATPRELRVQVLVHAVAGTEELRIPLVLLGRSEPILRIGDHDGIIDLGEVGIDGLTRTFELPVIRGAHPMQWDQLKCEVSGDLRAEVVNSGGDRWTLMVGLNSQAAFGLHECQLIFHFFDHGERLPRTLRRAMKVEVVGPIAAGPRSLLVGSVLPDSVSYGEFHVQPKVELDRKSLLVEDISANGAGAFRFELGSAGSNAVRVRYAYAAPRDTGAHSGQIRALVRYGDDSMALTIPYYAYVVPEMSK